MKDRFVICGIAGSLRKQSVNAGLLRAAIEVCPGGIEIRPLEIADLPPYNADLDPAGVPPVARVIDAIAAADALLIASPEYNFSIPGFLKNAIDWASMPPRRSVLRHKPVAVMGASSGKSGTMRAQLALRAILSATESLVMLQPEIYIQNAVLQFDSDGSLVSPELRGEVRGVVDALRRWAHRVRDGSGPDL